MCEMTVFSLAAHTVQVHYANDEIYHTHYTHP